MANLKASVKDIRKTKKRNARNTERRSRVRTFVKEVELAVNNKDVAKAKGALNLAQKELMKAVNKGVLKLETASRKLSRLNAKIKAIAIK